MIGYLPTILNVCGKNRAIRSDYRVALLIFEAYADPELSEPEKIEVMLRCLYADTNFKSREEIDEAARMAAWYLDGGTGAAGTQKAAIRILDWQQDEQIIFSAVNKIAATEIRALPYLHWWTFLGYFNEVGEGLLATVINIRSKKAKMKKLEKWELEFYRSHKAMVELKKRYTKEEQAEIDRLNTLLD